MLTTKTKEALLAGIQENAKADMKVLLQAAEILRRDIASRHQWRFQGSFEDKKNPTLLQFFCKRIIQGAYEVKTNLRMAFINQCGSVFRLCIQN